MATVEYARMIVKSSAGPPTIPPSSSHDNGDWTPNDIYEFEIYVDSNDGSVYTRVGNSIIGLGGLQSVTRDGTLYGDGTSGNALGVRISANPNNLLEAPFTGPLQVLLYRDDGLQGVGSISSPLRVKISQTPGNIATIDPTDRGVYVNRKFNASNTADSNTITNTTTETLFTGTGLTFTVPANVLRVGSKILCRATGKFSTAGAAPTLNLRAKAGPASASTLNATGARLMQNNQTNQGLRIGFFMTVRSVGALGTASVQIDSLFAEGNFADGSIVPSNGTKSIDTTVSNVFALSAQWGTANANNQITLENIDWELIY